MIVISGVLVLVALALLVIGVAGPDLAFVYASIAVSLVSLGFLVAGVVQRRDQKDAPIDGSQPELLRDDVPVESDRRAAGGSRRGSAAVEAGPRAIAEDSPRCGVVVAERPYEQQTAGQPEAHGVAHEPSAAPVAEQPPAERAVEDSVAEPAVQHAVVAVPVVEQPAAVPAHGQFRDEHQEPAVEASYDEDDGAADGATAAPAAAQDDARTDQPDGSPGEGASGEGVAARDQVLVVAGRPRYHAADCRYLTGKDPEGIPSEQARARGFAPCGVCKPDAAVASLPEGSGEPEDGTDDGRLGSEQADAGDADGDHRRDRRSSVSGGDRHCAGVASGRPPTGRPDEQFGRPIARCPRRPPRHRRIGGGYCRRGKVSRVVQRPWPADRLQSVLRSGTAGCYVGIRTAVG